MLRGACVNYTMGTIEMKSGWHIDIRLRVNACKVWSLRGSEWDCGKRPKVKRAWKINRKEWMSRFGEKSRRLKNTTYITRDPKSNKEMKLPFFIGLIRLQRFPVTIDS